MGESFVDCLGSGADGMACNVVAGAWLSSMLGCGRR
jgi:hypothetical protein